MLFPGFSHKKNVWTGWNDIAEEGNFIEMEFIVTPVEWTNWGVTGRGRPEPDGGRRENCVAAEGGDFSWHDYSCDAKHLPLCIVLPAH